MVNKALLKQLPFSTVLMIKMAFHLTFDTFFFLVLYLAGEIK